MFTLADVKSSAPKKRAFAAEVYESQNRHKRTATKLSPASKKARKPSAVVSIDPSVYAALSR